MFALILTLALFAFLAAVYMTCETGAELREEFRRSALASGALASVLAGAVWLLARVYAEPMHADLAASGWSLALHLATAATAGGALYALYRRRWGLARLLAILQVTGIVVGFGLAMNRHLVLPDVHIDDFAAPSHVIHTVLVISAVGAVILAPALFWLVRIFKTREQGAP